MPLSVSIITPSYNQGRFLERTISSVLSQRVGGTLEYLVMDGGSQDESVEILKRHGGSLQWVSERDRGQADAVNKGLARAKGDIIGWLNSDDIYYPGAIQTACDFFLQHPDAEVVYGNGNHIDESDQVIEPYPIEDWNPENLKERCYLCQPAVFFRRSVVERHGALNLRFQYTLDYEYWLRLAAANVRFKRLDALLAGSRLHAETKTLGSRVKVHRETNFMLRERIGRVPDRWLFNYGHAVLDDKGISRSHRVRFTILVSILSLYSALRWNGHITRDMLRLSSQWVGSALRDAVRS